MAVIVYRHWPQLKALDIEHLPQAQSTQTKQNILEERLKRKFVIGFDFIWRFLRPVMVRLKDQVRVLYHKILAKEKFYREAKEKLDYIPFGDSNNIKIGEWVLAVGNPYNLTSTVTAGIISAKSRDLDGDKNIQSFLQTDAVVNPGNSGGALVNTRGELVGINTAISSRTGSYIGYSFAVPSNTTQKIVQDILEYGNVQQAVLGVTGYGLNNGIANKLELKDTEGYYISEIEPNSGAEKSGLKGSVI